MARRAIKSQCVHCRSPAEDEWEAALIASAKGVKTEDPESEEEEPAEEVVVMSTKQAVSQMRNILTFARRSGDAVRMINIATKLQGMVEDCAVRQAGAAKQMTIGDFLCPKVMQQ